MGRIPDEDIQRVRDATDLVSVVSETVVLNNKGRLLWGLCPFHGEKTPSFKVDPATQLWHCFGCSEGGDVFGFVMRTQNLEFPDAVRMLAERAGIEIHEEGGGLPPGRKERLIAACEAAADHYHMRLTTGRDAGAAEARAYLKGRGFGIETAKRFRLGYAPTTRDELTRALTRAGFTRDELVEANLSLPDGPRLKDRFFGRIMFPISDLNGRVIAFGGRVIGSGEPKYLNSQETPIFHKSSALYGLDRARNEIVVSGSAVVVEGYTDVIALAEAGIGFAVATLGTALTERHVRLLGRFASRVVYLFDGDAAGIRAAKRAAEFIDWHVTPEAGSARVELAVAVIPEGKDPADYVAEKGPEAVRALVKEAQPLLRFVIDQRLAEHDLSTPEGKARALDAAVSALASVKGSILAQEYANYVADRLLTDFAVVQRALAGVRPERGRGGAETADKGSSARGAGSGADGAKGGVTPAGGTDPAAFAVTGDPRQHAAERELLRLAAVSAHARGKARDLLEEGLVLGEENIRLLRMVLDAGAATGGALFEAVARTDREAAEMLSAWLMDTPNVEEVEYAVREIAGRLKDFALAREILAKKAQMRGLDPAKDEAAFDDLFKEIAELQRKQQELRRHPHEADGSGGGHTA
ncbi:MAG: DNA primase [Coriobacteriia bacterium]